MGDLGYIISLIATDDTNVFFEDSIIKVDEDNTNYIFGRSIVIHGTDGSRISCGVIRKLWLFVKLRTMSRKKNEMKLDILEICANTILNVLVTFFKLV